MPAMSDRLRRIVGPRGIRGADTILEIGCGHGVAAGYIAERLSRGSLLAIDRSERMLAAARARNQAFIAAGRVEFAHAELESFDPGRRRFDKILAVRVGLFHRHPAETRARVERWLRPGGRLFVVYDEPR